MQRQLNSGLHGLSREISTQTTIPQENGRYFPRVNLCSSFEGVSSMVYAQVEEIPKSVCIACVRHCIENLFRYLTFEPLWASMICFVKLVPILSLKSFGLYYLFLYCIELIFSERDRVDDVWHRNTICSISVDSREIWLSEKGVKFIVLWISLTVIKIRINTWIT